MKSPYDLSRWQISTLIAGIAIGGLLVLWPLSPVPVAPDAIAMPVPVALDPAAVPRSVAALSSTRDRPLFAQTRRSGLNLPLRVPEDIVPATLTDIDDYVLKGTLKQDNVRRALIEGPANPSGLWIGEGDQIDRWTVVSIELDHILLGSGDVVTSLSLHPRFDQDGNLAKVSE